MESNRLTAAADNAVWMRNYQRARARALTKLAKTYPEKYKELFEQEKLNDYTQGTAWIDLDGNTSSSLDTDTNSLTGRGGDTSAQAEGGARASNL